MSLEAVPASCRSLQIGKYQVQSHIASGGMGAVYRALDPGSGREVALKVLPPDIAFHPSLLERFRREARHGLKLRHENLVAVYDFGEVEGTFYLAMELVDGLDLDQHIRRNGPLDAAEACEVLFQIARALEHAWQAGIIHRDIKPANILLSQQNGRRVAKLADLGLAIQANDEEFHLTRDGSTVGTVDYMSPEQARDSRAVDVRSDIYSLGCTAYHLLAGRPPFPEGNLTERIVQHARARPTDVRQFNSGVSEGLATILEKMLAKKPEDRYQTPGDLLRDLNWEMTVNARSCGAASEDGASNDPEACQVRGSPHDTRVDTPAGLIAADSALDASALLQFERATQYLAGGIYQAALPLLRSCCRRDRRNQAFLQALRQAHGMRRQKASTPAWLGRLGSLLDQVRLRWARRAGNSVQVLECGEQILARDPANLATHLFMAEAAEELDWVDLARWLLDQALTEEGGGTVIRRALADFHERHDHLEEAIALWKAVSQADPRDCDAPRKLNDLLALTTIARTQRAAIRGRAESQKSRIQRRR